MKLRTVFTLATIFMALFTVAFWKMPISSEK